MSRKRSRMDLRVLALVAVLACGKTAQTPPPAPALAPVAAAAAGTVEALEGHVTAQRAQAPAARSLALRDSVWADDTVVTADQASVSIRLRHNHALWLLEGGQSRRVDSAAAWRAPQQAAQVALADHQAAPTTASAGRHSEQEAAQTGEAATRPAAVMAPAPSAAEQTKPAAAEHRQRVVAGVQKAGALRSMGGTASGNGGIGLRGAGGQGAIGLGTGGGGESSVSPVLVAEVTLTPEVRKGEADPANLTRFLNRARVAIRVAYDRALRSDPSLRGTVVVLVTIHDGHVTDIALESKGEAALTDCVTVPLRRVAEATLDGVEVALTVRLTVKE